MSKVSVYYAPDTFVPKFWSKDSSVSAEEFKQYRFICSAQCMTVSGESAAEHMFDISNNPAQELGRDVYFGDNRSLSAGDIVEVDGVKYLCLSMGWKKLNI